MANSSIITDLFKFMSVRPIKKQTAVENDFSYLRDRRIIITGEVIDTYQRNYDLLYLKIINEIFGNCLAYYDPSEKTFQNIKDDITTLLNNFENSLLIGSGDQDHHEVYKVFVDDSVMLPNSLREFGITETDRLFINDLTAAIKKYLLSFDRCLLIKDIECVIKTFNDNQNIPLHNFIEQSTDGLSTLYYRLQEKLFNCLYIQYIFKRKYPLNLEYMLTGLRTLNVLFWLDHDNRIEPCTNGLQSNSGCLSVFHNLFGKKNNPNSLIQKGLSKNPIDCIYKEPEKTVLNTATDLNIAFNATVAISPVLSSLCFYKSPFNLIKPIGMGDLKIVKEKLCRYEAGEIAHIENVLRGESKERIHRRLDRLEDIFTRETEQVQENTRDTQTTDRFEVKKEIENTVSEDMQANVNASGSISGSYGLVQYNAAASAGFSYGRSTSDATRSANNYVKEIVDRSVTRVQNKISETRITKKINEVEETNRHVINNEKSTSNVSGIYRYVDKRYKSQLYNYGKRVMFEFIIPEPAFFFKSVFEKLKTAPINIGTEPVKPDFPAIQINSITQTVVDSWAAKLNLTSVNPEPADEITIGFPINNTDAMGQPTFQANIPISQDYCAEAGNVLGSYTGFDRSPLKTTFGINIYIGQNIISESERTPVILNNRISQNPLNFHRISEKVPVSILTYSIVKYILNIEITAKLKAEVKRKWQIDTYNKIMDAYDNAFKDYENKLAEYNNKKESADAQNSGVEIKGQNPKFNVEIIKAEFKKHCISIITKDYDTDSDADFVSTTKAIGERTIDATTNPKTKIPALNLAETKKISSFIQFIEQAFDWNNLTYLLYSYLWHTENKWYNTFKTYEETDPLFGAFLRAGSARVLVPVLPIYEISVMHFLCTKEVWNGGEAPAIDDELYIPIHEEIRNQQDDLNGAVPELDKDGKPIVWEYVVPTPLVYLQDNFELPVFNCNII